MSKKKIKTRTILKKVFNNTEIEIIEALREGKEYPEIALMFKGRLNPTQVLEKLTKVRKKYDQISKEYQDDSNMPEV